MQSELIITNPARLLAPSHLKRCTHKDCLQWKPYSEFVKSACYADGYKGFCRQCLIRYAKQYYHSKKASAIKYESCKWKPPVSKDANSCRWRPPVNDLPEELFLPETIRQIIRRQLAERKKREAQLHLSIIKILPFEEFMALNLISKPKRYIPCEEYLQDSERNGQYFLGRKVPNHYQLPSDMEFVREIEFVYGEPSSSFRDLLTAQDPDKLFSEQSRDILENRPELLRVA